MTKKKYLRSLRKSLKGIPEREKEKLVEYYAEMIDESRERGKTDKEIFADLESPEQVARDYFNANEGAIDYDDYDRPRRRPPRRRDYDDYGDYGEPPRRRPARDYEDCDRPRRVREKKGGGGKALLLALTFPIWLPLLLAAFVVALGVFIAGVGIVIALAAVTLALFVGGIYLAVMSFGLVGAHGSLAAAQAGAGLALIGLGILVSMLVAPTARGFGAFTAFVFRGFRRSQKTVVARSHGALIGKAAVGLVFVIAGCAIGAFAMGRLDWRWQSLAVTGDFAERTEAISLAETEKLTVDSDNLSLTVKPSEDGEAKIVFSDSAEIPKTFSFAEGTLTLKSGKWSTNFWESQRVAWSHGVFFSAIVSAYNEAVLYLPAEQISALAVTVQNGKLRLENISVAEANFKSNNGYVSVTNGSFGSLSLKTNNGYVKLETVTSDSIVADTDNGYVKFDNVTSGTLEAQTDNGAISLNRVSSDSIKLRSGNGSVNGSLIGRLEDYKIVAKTQLGSCNLQNTETGERSLEVRTGCGEIKISFEE